jgi:hypothetical protein
MLDSRPRLWGDDVRREPAFRVRCVFQLDPSAKTLLDAQELLSDRLAPVHAKYIERKVWELSRCAH